MSCFSLNCELSIYQNDRCASVLFFELSRFSAVNGAILPHFCLEIVIIISISIGTNAIYQCSVCENRTF